MKWSPEVGSRVTVVDRRGYETSGFVSTAINWGTVEQPDWYIEFFTQWEPRKGYFYVKQVCDGLKSVTFG